MPTLYGKKLVNMEQKNVKNLVDGEKNRIFVEDDEPTALAFTDFSKPSPILEGEDAERFIRIMEENERKAKERSKREPTLEELKRQHSYLKILIEFEKNQIQKEEKELEELENKIKELEAN